MFALLVIFSMHSGGSTFDVLSSDLAPMTADACNIMSDTVPVTDSIAYCRTPEEFSEVLAVAGDCTLAQVDTPAKLPGWTHKLYVCSHNNN